MIQHGVHQDLIDEGVVLVPLQLMDPVHAVMAHNTAVRDGGSNILVQGEKVQFDVVYGPGGPKSKNVRRGDSRDSGERTPFSGGPE